jgi:hypothetical protein
MDEQNFFDFIDPILDERNFDWLGMLGYVPEKSPQVSQERKDWESIWAETDPHRLHWEKAPDTASDFFEQWLYRAQIAPDANGRGWEDYLWLEEVRPKGQIRYHVLVADWEGYGESSLFLWKEITRGWAFSRPLERGARGLLGHLVMRQGCTLGVGELTPARISDPGGTRLPECPSSCNRNRNISRQIYPRRKHVQQIVRPELASKGLPSRKAGGLYLAEIPTSYFTVELRQPDAHRSRYQRPSARVEL